MRRIQNTTNVIRTFLTATHKVKCGPRQFAELPDGVAAKWVERYGFVYADKEPEQTQEPEAKPKRTRKTVEDRV